MIGYLEGPVRSIIRDTVIVMSGGVGYRVFATGATLSNLSEGATASLWTHLAVRENAQDLYGFETREELLWFELLLSVSGIGPRSALAVLNSASVPGLDRAVRQNDPKALSTAFGIGKKTAEKIVLELKEKVGGHIEGGESVSEDTDIIEALLSLGYSAKEARDTIQALPKDLETPEERLRAAIRFASSGK